MDDMKEKYANFKEQVRQAADLVSIVSETVNLKRKGSRYWGCCPFHGEKTPSFTVDPAKGLFHCFGCGAGGDVFSFVMKRDHVEFPEALKLLAQKYGIPIPERAKTAREIAREQETKEVLSANTLAAKFFHSCLINTQYGKQGLAYLAGRGIGDAIIASFELGMAPPDFSTLHEALEQRGVKEAVLLKAGLVVARSHSSGVYDKFRERIMIPIKDPRGHVVGFTGRILNAEASPAKYMNTGETAWFHKGRLLFGLDRAASPIRQRQQALVVEGHMDAISLHAAGIDWAVASMGTAFTQQQAELLKRLTPEVVFCFDSDRAGREAALRAIPLALQAGLKCRVMHVTDGKDPDEFIRKEGRDAFAKLIENAQTGMDYQVEATLAQCDLETLGGKAEAVSKVLPFFRLCRSEVEAGERIRLLARRLTIDDGLIQREYRKLTHQEGQRKSNPEWLLQQKVKVTSPTEQAERHVLRALLSGVLPQPGQEGIVHTEAFTTPGRQEIFLLWLKSCQEGTYRDPRDLFAGLSEDGSAELTRILSLNLPEASLPSILRDCLNRLQIAALEKEYEKHSQLAEKYEKERNEKFLQELAECRRIKLEVENLTKLAQHQ